jgi:hypothetical protein
MLEEFWYSTWLESISLRRTSMAMRGLFSTRSGSRIGVNPDWYANDGSRSSSEKILIY